MLMMKQLTRFFWFLDGMWEGNEFNIYYGVFFKKKKIAHRISVKIYLKKKNDSLELILDLDIYQELILYVYKEGAR